MFNVLNIDTCGLIREHLVSYDKYATTVCGCSTQAWRCPYNRWVSEAQNSQFDFKWQNVMPCFLCSVEESGRDGMPSHVWLKHGGRWAPFKLSKEISRLLEKGVAEDEPRLNYLTPAIVDALKLELEGNGLRDPRECPTCIALTLERSVADGAYYCPNCNITISSTLHAEYRSGGPAVRETITQQLANEQATFRLIIPQPRSPTSW